MLAIIMVMNSYYLGGSWRTKKTDKSVELKKDESDSTYSEENNDIKGKNRRRNSKEYI